MVSLACQSVVRHGRPISAALDGILIGGHRDGLGWISVWMRSGSNLMSDCPISESLALLLILRAAAAAAALGYNSSTPPQPAPPVPALQRAVMPPDPPVDLRAPPSPLGDDRRPRRRLRVVTGEDGVTFTLLGPLGARPPRRL